MTYYFFSGDRTTRKHDLDMIAEAEHSNDPIIRANARESAQKIMKESSKIRSMRERLIKEHRRGNRDNIKDIHEYVQKHSEYRNE
jgi:fumarylacetoacetate (FAA) hydrolase family protein